MTTLVYSPLIAKPNVDPPFSGTIFIDADIITDADPTAFQTLFYIGQANRTMFDRRVDRFITINAYLFHACFSDGLTTEVQVNPEFGSVALAQIEAEKYTDAIGRLPTALRTDVQSVSIHKGDNPFGGGNNNLLIHTGQGEDYIASGILEETLVHEAAHTSLDAYHMNAAGWLTAQNNDPTFISTYARDNPTREDIAESFLCYLAVTFRTDRISTSLKNTINQTIPNRNTYFAGLSLDMYPIVNYTEPENEGCIAAYCIPAHSGNGNEYITNVSIGAINNTSGAYTSTINGYSDFTALNTSVAIGNSYPITITPNYSFPASKVGVWADWNNNLFFEVDELIASFTGEGPWNTNIVPAQNAVSGNIRLRVRLQYGADYSPSACNEAAQNGETEDYTLVIAPSCPVDLSIDNITGLINNTVEYQVSNDIVSSATVLSGDMVNFKAGNMIRLTAGFEAKMGSVFHASIDPCTQDLVSEDMVSNFISPVISASDAFQPTPLALTLMPNPVKEVANIYFYLPDDDTVSLSVFNQSGILVKQILKAQEKTAGEHHVRLNKEGLDNGLFYIVLQNSKEQLIRKLIFIKN